MAGCYVLVCSGLFVVDCVLFVVIVSAGAVVVVCWLLVVGRCSCFVGG